MVLKKSSRKNAVQKLPRQKVAIVMSLFNTEISDGLKNGALKALQENGVAQKDVTIFTVPGAFEIPLVAQKVAQSKKFTGVVALGCVIRGDTPHFEFVSLAATMGCLQAGLTAGKPITFGVITVNTTAQALERSRDNDFNKGREAVLALLDTLATLNQI